MKNWLIEKGWIRPFTHISGGIDWKTGFAKPGSYIVHGFYIVIGKGFKFITKKRFL